MLVQVDGLSFSDERLEVRIERGLVADGQPARQATVRPRSVSCCWQNVGRESLGLGSGWWVGSLWQCHRGAERMGLGTASHMQCLQSSRKPREQRTLAGNVDLAKCVPLKGNAQGLTYSVM